jgi:hypothetical protein
MSGTILGKDQIDKVNALYGRLYAHVKALLAKDGTAFERLKVYMLTEFLNDDELARIFEELTFLAPIEKKILVRMAITEAHQNKDVPLVEAPRTDNAGVVKRVEPEAPKVFTPPPFRLNPATTEAHNVK